MEHDILIPQPQADMLLREAAERAVREKRITPSERYKILQTFEDGLRGYTYFER